MVIGVGVDMVSVPRIKSALIRQGDRLMSRIFLPCEIDGIGEGTVRYQKLAARFAAKEAVMKSIGTGLWQVALTDILILKHPSGKPYVELKGRALAKAQEQAVKSVLLSMSHEGMYAIAYATAIGE